MANECNFLFASKKNLTIVPARSPLTSEATESGSRGGEGEDWGARDGGEDDPGGQGEYENGRHFLICIEKKKLTIVCDITGRSGDEEANGGERGGEEEDTARRERGSKGRPSMATSLGGGEGELAGTRVSFLVKQCHLTLRRREDGERGAGGRGEEAGGPP